MQQKELFEALRKRLPHRYSKYISENVDGVSISQVQLIFKGEITDPEKVVIVKAAALKLETLHKRNKRLLYRRRPKEEFND